MKWFNVRYLLTVILFALGILLFFCSCAVNRQANGSLTADLGRDAGIVMNKTAEGDLYVVLDQNESKALRSITSTIMSRFLFDSIDAWNNEETIREAQDHSAGIASQQIEAQSSIDILSETNRSAEAIAEIGANSP